MSFDLEIWEGLKDSAEQNLLYPNWQKQLNLKRAVV